MNKRRSVFVGILTGMTVLLLGGIAQTYAANSSNGADSSIAQSIKEKQEQIERAEREKNGLKQNLSNVQQIKKGLESKKDDLNNYVAELDTQIALIEEKVNNLKNEIVLKEDELADTQLELECAVDRETGQMESMIIRAQQMYENRGSLAAE
ncbi:MAG: hypothetical protein IKS85_05130, partial [Lachnospiraceae bacterium]|nr:hypothetical protein [Lachnospiraceae bacterium]